MSAEDQDERRTEVAMQELATEIGEALSEVFGGRERVGSVRVVDAQEAVCRVLDHWEIPGGLGTHGVPLTPEECEAIIVRIDGSQTQRRLPGYKTLLASARERVEQELLAQPGDSRS